MDVQLELIEVRKVLASIKTKIWHQNRYNEIHGIIKDAKIDDLIRVSDNLLSICYTLSHIHEGEDL